MRIGRLKFRNARPDDVDRVKGFYARFRHANNLQRGDEELLAMLGYRHKVFVFEVVDATEAMVSSGGVPLQVGDFCAAAFIAEHLADEARVEPGWREAGGARVVLGGFGLQNLLNYARSVHDYVLDPMRKGYFAVAKDTPEAKRTNENIVAAGFEPWQPDPELAAYKRSHQKDDDPRAFYLLPRDALPAHARALLDLDLNPFLTRPDRAQEGAIQSVAVEMDLAVLRIHRPQVERLANGEFDIFG
jgi:hypothetical protein